MEIENLMYMKISCGVEFFIANLNIEKNIQNDIRKQKNYKMKVIKNIFHTVLQSQIAR